MKIPEDIPEDILGLFLLYPHKRESDKLLCLNLQKEKWFEYNISLHTYSRYIPYSYIQFCGHM